MEAAWRLLLFLKWSNTTCNAKKGGNRFSMHGGQQTDPAESSQREHPIYLKVKGRNSKEVPLL